MHAHPRHLLQLCHQSRVGAAQPLRVEALFLRGERVPERAHQRAEPRQVGGRGPAWRGGRRAARQLERPAVLHAITVIDHEHRERHGKGGACHGACGISDLKVIQRSNPLPERIDAGQPRASSGSAGGFGTAMAMAFAIAIIFLPAVMPFSTPAVRCTLE